MYSSGEEEEDKAGIFGSVNLHMVADRRNPMDAFPFLVNVNATGILLSDLQTHLRLNNRTIEGRRIRTSKVRLDMEFWIAG